MTLDATSAQSRYGEVRQIFAPLMKSTPEEVARMEEEVERIQRGIDPEIQREQRRKQDATEAHSVFKKGEGIIAVQYRGGGIMLRGEANGLNVQGMMKEAEDLGLQGEQMHDFIAAKMTATLKSRLGGVDVESYENGNAPTQGELTREIFGTSGYTMDFSTDTSRELLKQQEEESNRAANDEGIPLSPYLWDIVNNPDYAEQEAKNIGNSYDLPFFPTGADVEAHMKDSKNKPIFVDGSNPDHPVLKTQAERAELYQYLKDQGMASIDIIKEIYLFNASLPDSYFAIVDPTRAKPRGHYKQQQLDNLHLLAQYEQNLAANANAPQTRPAGG